MRANQLLLQNIIDVNPRTGLIKLHDTRMALISVEALGILRTDLINTLGKDRAKGFLMRYGWAYGKETGRSLAEEYEWESLRELLLAGPAMHTMEGLATVEADVVEFDGEKVYFTGYWHNSFEVSNHLQNQGVDSEAICWILQGFASGYLTKVFGKEVIAYEKSCRGKGDHYCYFVAETVAHCAAEHLQHLRYYQTESLQSALDDTYLEIEQLNKDIVESEEVRNELTDLFLEGQDLYEIIKKVGETLKRSIVIDYLNDIYTSYYHHKSDELSYLDWKNNSETITATTNDVIFNSFPLQSHQTDLARVVVIGKEKLSQRESLIIQRALVVLTIKLYHQSKITESLWQRKEEFLNDLVDDKIEDEVLLSRQASFFGLKPNEPAWVIAIKLQNRKRQDEVSAFLTKNYAEVISFQKEQYIVMILSKEDYSDMQDYMDELLDEVSLLLSNEKVYIGSGRSAETIRHVSASYSEATRICDFIELTHPLENRCVSAKELSPLMMFLKSFDPEEMVRFYTETIGELVKYDEENQGSFLVTLRTYLENNGNLQQTADDLHLSIAGLRYRIERIESLCGVDLRTGTDRFNCQLATKIYFALQVMNK